MTRVERYLTDSDIAVLKELRGRTLDYIAPDFFRNQSACLQKVEFGVGDSRYYLYCDTEILNYFGAPEDITVFEFSTVRYPYVDMAELVEVPVGLVVTGIAEVKDIIQYYEDGELDFEYSFTRGLIFYFGDFQIAFEKTSDFTEFIEIHKGNDVLSSFDPVDVYLDDFKEGCDVRLVRNVDVIF